MQASVFEDWRVRGSYFECCNCDAICPCRSVHGRRGGPSTFGVCFGTLSWHVHDGHAGPLDLSGLDVVLSLRYRDAVQPSTPWEVVLYVDDRADEAQHQMLADIFLGRAGGTVAALYGPAIGEVHAVRRARITVEHIAARKRIDVVGYITVEAEGVASEPGRRPVRYSRLQPPWHRVLRAGTGVDRRGAAMGDPRRRPGVVRNRLRLSLEQLKHRW